MHLKRSTYSEMSRSTFLGGGGEGIEDIPRMQFWPIRVYVLCICTHIPGNLSVYMHTYRHKAKQRIELVVTFYVYMRICPKKSHFMYFWVKRETHPKFMRTLTFAI